MFGQSRQRTRELGEHLLKTQQELQEWQIKQLKLGERQSQLCMEANRSQMELGFQTWRSLSQAWLSAVSPAAAKADA